MKIVPVTEHRAAIFGFVQAQFQSHFNAHIIDEGLPLFAALDQNGVLQAAFCLNDQADTFFCQHYIGDAQTAIAQAYPQAFSQAGTSPLHVVELSHLALASSKAMCRLCPALVSFLESRTDYLICTVTQAIAHFLAKKALAPLTIGHAAEHMLPPAQQGKWGSYYEHNPVVVTGDLAYATLTTQAA